MVLNAPTKMDVDLRSAETPARTAARIMASAVTSFKDGAHETRFEALGTKCRISFAAPANAAPNLVRLALNWVAAFEAKYSRFLPGSLISKINAAAGKESVAIDAETERIFALCDQIHFMTRGIFDPTALPLLRIWNWRRGIVPSEAEIEEARALVGWKTVQRKPGGIFLPREGMGLDLGGMGKEYAVDSVAQLLANHGAASVLVDFGADVRVIGLPADGRPAWHIGLDDPRNSGRCWCGLGVLNAGVATSGDYIRGFQNSGRRYGHILDIRTGQPVQNDVLAVSVMAPSCTQAGMISTAAFVLGPREGAPLLEMPGVCGAMVTAKTVQASRHFYEYVVS